MSVSLFLYAVMFANDVLLVNDNNRICYNITTMQSNYVNIRDMPELSLHAQQVQNTCYVRTSITLIGG